MRTSTTSLFPHTHSRNKWPQGRFDAGARRGNIMLLSALGLIFLFAFTAFAVDIGYLSLTRTQMQLATDSAALGAGLELSEGLKNGNPPSVIAQQSRVVAVQMAALHKAADRSTVYIGASDVQIGHRSFSPITNKWEIDWDTAPYNVIRVSAHRDRAQEEGGTDNGDGPIPLFFAPVIGSENQSMSTSTTVAMVPASGFRLGATSSQTVNVLPIAYDMPSWNAYAAGNLGADNYSYNALTRTVMPGQDGVKEFDLYPYSSQSLPSGNRGTVDFGSSNNSTNDLKRQIEFGLNASDLSYFGGQLRVDNGPLIVNGDTGISAGIKAPLEAIIGKPRAIPIFTSVSGPGNNAMYHIEKFVGIRIMVVKLTGGNKQLLVQSALVVDPNVITTTSAETTSSIVSPPRIVE